MKFNPYYYLFYLMYKFIKLTTPEDKKAQVLESSYLFLTAMLTLNIITCLLITGLGRYFPQEKMYFWPVFVIIPIFLWLINKRLFVYNERYREVEAYYDKENNLKKGHFILLAVIYILLSLGGMILAGMYYKTS